MGDAAETRTEDVPAATNGAPPEAEAPRANGAARQPLPADASIDTTVSFAELVWAHHERQKELAGGEREGEWEREYRDRLRRFKREQGEIFEAYWCRFEASGVAITEKQLPRRLTNFFRRDSILRLHTVTDWRTSNAPLVATLLHDWETLGIKAGEVLRETSERITLQSIFAASSRLLGFVDRKAQTKLDEAMLRDVVDAQREELADVTDYYERAGENSARIVYFRGMVWGAAFLAAPLGTVFGVGWALGWIDPSEVPTQTLFVTPALGAAGAILSVMTRMARKDGFNLDFEVGRKLVRFLGGLRPWIGALFALALYLALKSSVLELFQNAPKTVYFYGTIAFLAGFSERWAKVLLDRATSADAEDGRKREPLASRPDRARRGTASGSALDPETEPPERR
jgi:hypothetical protein